MKYLVAILVFSISFIITHAQTSQEQYTVAELSWTAASFPIKNVIANATIQLVDPDMNKFSSSIDTVQVFAFSDSYSEGLSLTLYETERDSGIFERTFGLSEQRSAPNILFTREGDTITAKYVDATLPPPYTSSDKIELRSTAFAGTTGPPLERAPASNARIIDSRGNSLDIPAVGEQVQLTSDIANGQDYEQKFTWIAQILNEQNKVVSLGWINGTLNPGSAFSPSISWIPEKEGKYTAIMFVWESIDNPSALSPPIAIDFEVGPQELRKQRYTVHDEMFLFIIPQEDFKTYMTKEKLAGMHFYKIKDKEELSKLPRLGLLINMTRDFTQEPIKNLKLRISDSQLELYRQFFIQKCHEERPYTGADACNTAEFAFEYGKKWHYVYKDLAPSKPTIEDSSPSWDANYFGSD